MFGAILTNAQVTKGEGRWMAKIKTPKIKIEPQHKARIMMEGFNPCENYLEKKLLGTNHY